MRQQIVLAFISCIGLSILSLPGRASACVCAHLGENERADVARAFAGATVVFEGEVAAARTQGDDVIIQFKVIKAYKGMDSNSIELIEPHAFSDCGFGLPSSGAKYFIYGLKNKDGKIYMELCRYSWGGADLRYARGEPPTEGDLVLFDERLRLMGDPSLATRGATLRGRIAGVNPPETANAYVTVWQTDEKGHRQNLIATQQKVRPDGSFQIRFLPPGTYFVTAVDYRPTSKGRGIGDHGKISLKEKQTLSIPEFRLRLDPLGSVVVHVVAPPEVHDRIFVWVHDVELGKMEGKLYPQARTSELDPQSTARFNDFPYGLYGVDVLLIGEISNKPSWTYDATQLRLNGSVAECTVTLRKNE